MKKLFLIFALAVLGFLPTAQLTFAQGTSTATCDELKQRFANANSADLAQQFPQFCNEGRIYDKIVNILYYFIGIAGVIALIYGGYVYMLARGNEQQAAKGRQIITWAVIGVVLAVMAAAIVGLVVRALQDNNLF